MAEEKEKLKFDRAYWLGELIYWSKALNPGKFTDEYKQKLRTAWADRPLTDLQQRACKRREEAALPF